MTLDINTGTDLAALHQAITTVSAAAFPGVHFEFYRADRKTALAFGDGAAGHDPVAYCFLELSQMEPGDATDPGTEQQAMTATFEAQFVLRSVPVDARLQARILAGAFAAFLRKTLRFDGTNVLQGPIQVTGCYKDDFSPELDQYEVWRVEWTQEIWLGAGVWGPSPSDPATPTQVLYSFYPLIGPAYEPSYLDATGAPRT